jgi:hypothetical protein
LVPNNAAFRSIPVGLATALGTVVGAEVGTVLPPEVALGEAVAVLFEHAANTRTAVESNPIKRFDIDILPVGCCPLQQGASSVQVHLPFSGSDNLEREATSMRQSGGRGRQ